MEPTMPWNELQVVPPKPLPDHGPDYLETLLRTMMVDEEWLVRGDRSVRWWGGPLPMTITASEPRIAFGDPSVKLTARIRVLREVSTDASVVLPLMAATNAMSAGFSMWIEPFSRDLWLSTTHYAHEGNPVILERGIFATFVLLAYGAAHARLDLLHEVCGGEVAIEEHPELGERRDLDELLYLADSLVQPRGQAPSAWIEPEFEAQADRFSDQGLLATSGPNGMTTEFPYTGLTPHLEQIALGFEDPGGLTSLYTMVNDDPHPELGNGLLVVLKLPEDLEEADGFVLSNGLNWAEANELTGFPAWGSWTFVNDGSDGHLLAHPSFYPNLVHMPGLITAIGFYDGWRGIWAQERLVDPELVASMRTGLA